MGIEYELKFSATPAQQAALRQKFAGEEQVYAMQTTYFDTPSGAFSAHRYTLRIRQENGKQVCTLKTPAPSGRGEWEVECDAIEAALPVLCQLGAPVDALLLAAEGLLPVCGARFTRIAKLLTLPDCRAELALDTGILTGGGRELPLCEVDLELKSGSREALNRFAAALAQETGLQAEPRSKFRRALALYKGE